MPSLKRYLQVGALVGAYALPAAIPAPAAVVLDAASGGAGADAGGLPIVPSGPLRLTCTQYGAKIADERVRDIAVSPLNAIGWLSFEQGRGSGRSILLPFGDGGTSCLISPDGAYLKQAAAAFRAAITENRPVDWGTSWRLTGGTGRARAEGRVAPTRTFLGSEGRPCRSFVQTVSVDGRVASETGTACQQPGGTWRVVP